MEPFTGQSRRPPLPRLVTALLVLAAALPGPRSLLASATKMSLLEQRLELPGVPVETLTVDLDRDGVRDLAVVVASTSWGETGIEEAMQVDEAGTFVDVLTVVPTLLDRRQLLVFRGRPAGGFEPDPRRLDLAESVHAIEAGPSGAPLVAWTDDGLAEVVAGTADALELVPRVVAPSLLSGSSSFVPRSGLAIDVDGDREIDLLLPVAVGLEVYPGSPSGMAATPRVTLIAPQDFRVAPVENPAPAGDGRKAEIPSAASQREDHARVLERKPRRAVALPQFVDLDGDGRPDAVYRDPDHRRTRLRALRQSADGSFGPPFDPLGGRALADGREIAWVGDLDGVPGAELVTTAEIPNEKDSMRAELAEAKRPRSRVFVHRLDGTGVSSAAPVSTFEIEGYVFEGGGGDDGGDGEGGSVEFTLPSGVHDLDGDGRLDLVAIRLDFSLFEAMRIMTTHSIRLGLDFAIYRQGAGLTFRPVTGLDLAGELRLRFDDVSIGQISSFAGDFDGDGRADFVQLGRGRKVTIHRGLDGARYAAAPDLAVTLEREPIDVALAQVRDIDGDGRSDLVVTQPVGGGEIGRRAALELHLSRGAP